MVVCCCISEQGDKKKKGKLSRTVETNYSSLEMQNAKILKVPSIYTLVVQLQTGAVVEAGLTTALTEQQYATISPTVTPTNPYDCQILLGEYSCKYNRFKDSKVDTSMLFQTPNPPIRLERIRYKK